MLVRFAVKNYRSFKEEQILSLEAGRQGVGNRGRSFPTNVKSAPQLLRGCVIYGANSGGKSNLIMAMDFFKDFVEDSARGQEGDPINVSPYLLSDKTASEPSQFEVIFILDGSTYQYGFAADQQKIHAEWLYETPKEGRIRHLFSREIKGKGPAYDWYINPRIKGERKLWQSSTRDNALFLSTAVQLNAKDLIKPFKWISSKFRILISGHYLSNQYTSHICHDHDLHDSVLDIMQSVDKDIVDIKTLQTEMDEKSIPEGIPDELRAKIIKDIKGQKVYNAEIGRISSEGSVVLFDLDEESTGTNILYNLAGPWIDTLCNGYTLVIDELDSGLHPLALRTLVSMFFDPKQNTGNAQLIITCHEATLLRDDLLRADQVWFIDKDLKSGSKLYPLSEFRPRQNESFLRGYLGGRYGGVPVSRSVV